MSHSVPPLSSFSRIPQHSQKRRETYLPPLDMLTGYRRHQSILSSSPIRSSSPPRTPYLPGYGQYPPYIQSSPLLDGNVELPPLRYRADDPPSIWGKPGKKMDNHLPASLKQASIGRGRHSSYFDDEDLPPSSEFEMGDHSEDVEMSSPELDSETASRSTPGHEVPSLSFSDSESEHHSNPTLQIEQEEAEEVGEDDEDFGYGNGGWRATFFRVSEERGRWQDDPAALKPTTTAGLRRLRLSRQSMPALSSAAQSRVPSVGPSSIATRTISEPLASTALSSNSCDGPSLEDDLRGRIPNNDANMEAGAGETIAVQNLDVEPLEPEQDPDHLPSASSQPATLSIPNSRHQSPNLDRQEHGEREATPARDPAEGEEVEEPPAAVTANYGNGYSSPLPPSSPPLSPMSGCTMSFSRSSSPLSFLPSSPSQCSVRGLDFDDVDDVVEEDEEAAQNGIGNDDPMADDRNDDTTALSIPSPNAASHSPFARASSSLLLEDIVTSSQARALDARKTNGVNTVDMMVEPSDELGFPASHPSPPTSRPTALSVSGPAANASTSASQPIASTSTLSPATRTSLEAKRPRSPSPVVERAAGASTSKAKGKHVRRESQGSEKENASVKGKAKMDPSEGGPTKKRKSVPSEAVPVIEDRESTMSRSVKKRKVEAGEDGEVVKAKSKKSKKQKGGEEESAEPPEAISKAKSKGKERATKDKDADVEMGDEEEEHTSASSKPKPRRKPKAAPGELEEHDDTPASTTTKPRKTTTAPKTSSRKRKSGLDAASSAPLEPEPFDDELTGMLIEVLATSRASSLAVSVLCRSVLQAHPYLKDEPSSSPTEAAEANGEGENPPPPADGGDSESSVKTPCPYPYIKNRKSDKSWKGVVSRVLLAGAVEGGGSGVFGKVESSGKDDSDRPLDAQWFYVPECDKDQDRATLLRSLMPRPEKRSETKKYKQYYWRPLDKISRWDREDDL